MRPQQARRAKLLAAAHMPEERYGVWSVLSDVPIASIVVLAMMCAGFIIVAYLR